MILGPAGFEPRYLYPHLSDDRVITPSEINRRYSLEQPYFVDLQKRVRETLGSFCDAHEFALVSRVKSLASVSEKIETGRFASWSEMDDLVAFTIVIPTLLEEELAINFLDDKFHRIDLRRRESSQKSPDVFRFDSTRFIGKLRSAPASERLADGIRFEVQVRTAFDHAWVVTTHALTYKSAVIDWKHQRLAAELKATAEKMDMLILAFKEASVKMQESPWPQIAAKKNIYRFFSTAAEKNQIPIDLLPKDWSRFTDNVYELGRKFDKRLKPEEIASTLIDAVSVEMTRLGPEKMPLSLSLWQLTLASLAKYRARKLSFPSDYWPLVTTELESLYPQLKDLHPRFEFSAD